jgi:hypothetical protein
MDWIVVKRAGQIGDSKVRHILAYPLPLDGETFKLGLWTKCHVATKNQVLTNISDSAQKQDLLSESSST